MIQLLKKEKAMRISPKIFLGRVMFFLVLLTLGWGTAMAQEVGVLTWNVSHRNDLFDKWVKEFDKTHPNQKIVHYDKKGSEWSTYYQTQVVAGTPPCVIDIQGGLWLEYASKGGLVDLTPYLERDAGYTKKLSPPILKSWVFEGKNYGVPFYTSKTLLFYNKLMFKEAGLTRPPETFKELLDYAAKMTKGEKSGFMTLNFDWLYWPLFAMNGVELLTSDLKKAAFNTPKTIKVVEALAEATKSGAIDKISWTGRWVKPNSAFGAGNIGMLQAHAPAFMWMKAKGNWMNKDTVGAAHMPGNWATPNSHSFLISAGCKHPNAAWEFIKIASSGQGAFEWGAGGSVLMGDIEVNNRLIKYFAEVLPVISPVIKTQVEHLDKLTGNWPIAKDAEVKEVFYSELQNALLGRKSAKDALASAEKKVNRVLRSR
jgi:ABC-type glycerol-3-phosphate transport system substrate-binding protein